MKVLQGLLLSLSFLFFMSNAYAECGAYGSSDCMDMGYYGCMDSVCSECECTDPECIRGSNPCMSKAKCCEAFGNVGAR